MVFRRPWWRAFYGFRLEIFVALHDLPQAGAVCLDVLQAVKDVGQPVVARLGNADRQRPHEWRGRRVKTNYRGA